MLMWCSYCQRFEREVPPYENLNITHGICAACRLTAFALAESDIAHVRSLQKIQSQLAEAGRHGDFKAAEIIEEDAVKANIRPIDILLGIVGAITGGWLFRVFGEPGVSGVNLYSLLVAVVGSVIFLLVYHAFRMKPAF